MPWLQAQSVDQVKMEVTSSIANVMLELHNRLLATEERALSAEAWAAAAEEEAAAARSGIPPLSVRLAIPAAFVLHGDDDMQYCD